MPAVTQKVKLGRDQVLSLDGVVLEGVREVDVEIDTTTIDVTPWNGTWRSHFPVVGDATIRLLIYWKENWDALAAKLMTSPPQAVVLEVSNGFTWRCVPTGVKVAQPIAGVLSWEVTLKPYWF